MLVSISAKANEGLECPRVSLVYKNSPYRHCASVGKGHNSGSKEWILFCMKPTFENHYQL